MDPFSYSLCPHFHRSGLGNDAGSGPRRRDAAGALASTALLGAYRVGGEFVSIFGGGMVDLLSLAQSTAVDVFPFYLCPDFAHHLVPGLYHSLSARICAGEFVNYKTHYYSNHRAFFIVFGLFTSVDIVDSLLKGLPHFLALGPLHFISGALFFAG
jgi:hypothetical protein